MEICKKVLVTGAGGQLGKAVCAELEKRGVQCQGFGHSELDVTDAEQIKRRFAEFKPDGVVHCAAYNKVDDAEKYSEICRLTNAEGTRLIAKECALYGAYMVYISSDYVFDGRKVGEYETSDVKSPLSVYGKSKSDGEDAALTESQGGAVLRTSWLYGDSQNNFVESIIRAGSSRGEIKVVNDQFGSPTFTEDLAALIADMLEKKRGGIFHGTNSGICRRDEFARKILEFAGIDARIYTMSSEQFGSAAERPKNSALSKRCLTAAGLFELPDWEDALERYFCKFHKKQSRQN